MVDYQGNDANGDAIDDATHDAERRERVVEAVLQRIASAPRVVVDRTAIPRVWVDIASWRVPALAAATIVMVASGAVILTTDRQLPQETVAVSEGGLPVPVARYLQTGVVAPMDWLNSYGGRP